MRSYQWNSCPIVCAICVCFGAVRTLAEDSAAAKLPTVVLTAPLQVTAGQTSKVAFRGSNLQEIASITVNIEGGSTKILTQGKVDIPQRFDVARAGDTQVEFEVTLPVTASGSTCDFLVVNQAGASDPITMILDQSVMSGETEPNDGFQQAQRVQRGTLITGQLHQATNVDVFQIECVAGETLDIDVVAARRNSLFDPLLSIYDDRLQLCKACDDLPVDCQQEYAGTLFGRRDARVSLLLKKTGRYFIVLQDANDLGGQYHSYRLKIK